MRRALPAAIVLVAVVLIPSACGGGGNSTHYNVDAVSRCLEQHGLTVKHLHDFGAMPEGIEGNLEVDQNGEEQVDLAFTSDASNARKTADSARAVAKSYKSAGGRPDLVHQKGNVTYWAAQDSSQLQLAEQCLGS